MEKRILKVIVLIILFIGPAFFTQEIFSLAINEYFPVVPFILFFALWWFLIILVIKKL